MAIRFDDDVVFINLIGDYALFYGLFEDKHPGCTYYTAPIGAPESNLFLHDNRHEVVSVVRRIYDDKLSPYAFADFYEAPAHVTIQEVNGIIYVQATPVRDQTFDPPWKYLYLGLAHSVGQIPKGDKTLFEYSKFITVPTDGRTDKIFRQAFVKVVELAKDSPYFLSQD